MIDISSEKLLTPVEIAAYIPRRRAGKKCNIATIYRWMSEGHLGIKLEYLSIGGTKCTTICALQKFFDDLTAQAEGKPVEPPKKLTKTRKKAIEAAEKRLERAGV